MRRDDNTGYAASILLGVLSAIALAVILVTCNS